MLPLSASSTIETITPVKPLNPVSTEDGLSKLVFAFEDVLSSLIAKYDHAE